MIGSSSDKRKQESVQDKTTPETSSNNSAQTQDVKWVGKVLPNELDFYDNPTYNATLYMIPPLENSGSSSQQDSNETSTDGSTKRKDTPSGENKKTGGGYLNGALKAAPENTVILAKTGVTAGITIDNIEIVTVTSTAGPIEKTVEFEIVQPGAASFPDMIIRAQQYLGIPTDTQDFPLFLEINFLGRVESVADAVDLGGAIRTIAGPYIFPLALKNFSIQIDQTGSRYNFNTVIRSELGYRPRYYKLPVLLTTVGKTITEHVKGPDGLEKKLNDVFSKNEEKESLTDIIEFDLSGLVADQKKMKEEHDKEADRFAQGINLGALGFNNKKEDPLDIINNPNPVNREKAQRNQLAENIKGQDLKIKNPNMIFNETLSTSETTTLQKIPGLENIDNPDPTIIGKVIDENKSSGFVTKKDSDKIEVYAKQGTTIKEYFEMLLSMNDEFFTKISKVINPGQPFIKEDTNKIATAKLDMDVEVVDLEYDAKRRKYVKKVIYKPKIVLTPAKTALTHEGLSPDTPSQAKNRIKEMHVQKAYSYIFTGRNDQIVNLDISYNNGLEFFLPVNGGLIGDPSLNTKHTSSEPVPPSENSSGIQELFDSIGKVKDVTNLFKLFKDKDEILNNVAGLLGFDSNTAKSFLSDANSSSAKAFATALQDKITRDSLSTLLLNKKEPSSQENTQTETDQQRIIDGTDNYKPTPSGYTYGLDLLGDTKQAEDLVKRETQRRVENSTKHVEYTKQQIHGGPTAKGINTNISHVAMATGIKSNRNSLMSYLFLQQATGRFLVDLNMTVRGDPFYLGKPTTKPFQNPETEQDKSKNNSDRTGIDTSFPDNFILLEINSPRYFDLNVDDEDANTGKWREEGKDATAYFFTGLYRLLTATHKFSNGFYTIDLTGAKETAVDLSQIESNADYSFEITESETLRNRANEYDKTQSDKENAKSPSWIRGYITGDRAVAGVRKGQPVTLSDLLERKIITSEEAEAYRQTYRNS